MKRLMHTPSAVILLLACSIAVNAQDWPRFRGPNGSGVADGQKPPVEFGPGKNLKWKTAVPGGFSSPVIAGDNIIITGFEGGKLYTIAYNRATGNQVWKKDARAAQIERYQRDFSSPATATAATDGKRIVVYFGSCGLICYNLTGKELWRYKLPVVEIYGDYGSGVSPILAGGLAILVRDDSRGSKIVAVDLATGQPRWERSRLSRVSWCTPVVWDNAGEPQVVSCGHGAMIGYDLKTGEEKWTVKHMPSGCASSPTVSDGTLYFSGWSEGAAGDKASQMESFDSILKKYDKNHDGVISRVEGAKSMGSFFDNFDLNRDGKISREEYQDLVNLMLDGKNGAYAIKPGGSGDITESHMLWKTNRGMGYIPTAIVYKGQLVMVKDGGIVTAVDAKTGKTLYMERLGAPGEYFASPIAANGNVYFASNQGIITVLKVGPKEGKVIAKSPKLDEHIGATPAIAGNTLYVRSNKHLYAFCNK